VVSTATATKISDIKYGHVAGKDFTSLKAYGGQNGSYWHKVSKIRRPVVDKGSTLVGDIAFCFLQCFDTVGWEEHLTCKKPVPQVEEEIKGELFGPSSPAKQLKQDTVLLCC